MIVIKWHVSGKTTFRPVYSSFLSDWLTLLYLSNNLLVVVRKTLLKRCWFDPRNTLDCLKNTIQHLLVLFRETRLLLSEKYFVNKTVFVFYLSEKTFVLFWKTSRVLFCFFVWQLLSYKILLVSCLLVHKKQFTGFVWKNNCYFPKAILSFIFVLLFFFVSKIRFQTVFLLVSFGLFCLGWYKCQPFAQFSSKVNSFFLPDRNPLR